MRRYGAVSETCRAAGRTNARTSPGAPGRARRPRPGADDGPAWTDGASGPRAVSRPVALALAGEAREGAALVAQLGPAPAAVALEAAPQPVRVVRRRQLGGERARLAGRQRRPPAAGGVQAVRARQPVGRAAQEADQQAGRVAQPALLPPPPDVVHRRHHRADAVTLDRLVQATGGEAEPVRPLAGLDLAVRQLVQGEIRVVGFRRTL